MPLLRWLLNEKIITMKKAYGILVVMLGLLVNTAFAQKPAVVADSDPGWKRIGQVTASFKKQNESIVVLGQDEFTAIKLKISEAPVNIERVQVFYESGEMEELDVRSELQAGSETKSLKLKQPYRDIKKVAFTYKTLPNTKGDKADVELYGLKTNQKTESDSYIEKRTDDAEKAEIKTEQAAERTENDVDRATENTGNEISEVAAKVMADIKDKKHQTKVGPGNQTIFIADDGQYYYIDNDGDKVFVTEVQLKDKPNKH
jgi:hypothetical protein